MIQQRIVAIVARLFRIDAATLAPFTSPADIANWDSFGHLELIEALQAEFRVEFEVQEISQMETLGAIEQILLRRGVGP
jgi:acyl carrier protein